MENEPLTTRLNDGRTVLAKMYEGEPYAVTYANRTQAAKRVALLGPGWYVGRGLGRPFYVVKSDAIRSAGDSAEFTPAIANRAFREGKL